MQGEKPEIKEKEVEERTSPELLSDSVALPLPEHTMPSMADIHAGADEYKPAVEASLVGELVDNQFKLTEILGKGGMSIVYKATDLVLKKEVAIKLMHPHLVSDQNAYLRFKQEAQAASHLDHANVIKVYNFGMTGGDNPQPFIVMDFIQGESLSETIRREGRLPVARALKIFEQVCNALSHAHGKGIIHRDLKPSNIMLVEKDGYPDFVKIVDFGIAKLLPQEGEQAARLTQTGDIFGSPTYMSPEQCRGQAVDKRSDVYALGCVLYEALCGRPPHGGTNVFETFHKHITEIPASLEIPNLNQDLIDRLDAVVFKALEKDPDKRYQSMSAFENDLRAIAEDQKSGLRGTKFGIKVVKQQRSLLRFMHSAPKQALIAALLLLLLSGVSAFLWFRFSWFFAPHTFNTAQSNWLEFLPPMFGKRADISEAVRRKELDNTDAAIMLLRAQGSNQSVELLNAWIDRAKVCSQLGAVAEEMEALNYALDVLNRRSGNNKDAQRKDLNYVRVTEQLGDCYVTQGKLQQARPMLEETIFVRETQSSSYTDRRVPRVYLELGYVYFKLGNSMQGFERALMYLNDGINILMEKGESAQLSEKESVSDSRQLAVLLALKGDTYKAMYELKEKEGSPAEAKKFLTEAENCYRDAGKTIGSSRYSKSELFMSELALSRAYVKLLQEQYKDAAQLYDKAVPFMQERLRERPEEMQEVLNAYAYSSFKSYDFIKADVMRNKSLDTGVATAEKVQNK
jgi:serine/threonine protein kinase